MSTIAASITGYEGLRPFTPPSPSGDNPIEGGSTAAGILS